MTGTEPSIRLTVATSVENQAINILGASDLRQLNALVNGRLADFDRLSLARPARDRKKGKRLYCKRRREGQCESCGRDRREEGWKEGISDAKP